MFANTNRSQATYGSILFVVMKGSRTAWASVLMLVILTVGAAALSIASRSSTPSTASLLLRYSPEIPLTNADIGRSYNVSIGTTVVVVLIPPPQWTPSLALGYNHGDVSLQEPTPLELRYDGL